MHKTATGYAVQSYNFQQVPVSAANSDIVMTGPVEGLPFGKRGTWARVLGMNYRCIIIVTTTKIRTRRVFQFYYVGFQFLESLSDEQLRAFAAVRKGTRRTQSRSSEVFLCTNYAPMRSVVPQQSQNMLEYV
jgi:hypothetical protein